MSAGVGVPGTQMFMSGWSQSSDQPVFCCIMSDMNPHQNPGVEKRFILSIAITTLILLAEVIGGIWTGSLALLSDSAHVFMDIFALALSFVALRLSALPPDSRHTYGYTG